jgi:hypothetical protein
MTQEIGLFDQPKPTAAPAHAGADAIDFVPTPGWFADAMVQLALRDLGPNDIVLEPTCGDGAILRQIPRKSLRSASKSTLPSRSRLGRRAAAR